MNYNDGYRIVPKFTMLVKAINLYDGGVLNNNEILLWETQSATHNSQIWIFEMAITELTLSTSSITLNK